MVVAVKEDQHGVPITNNRSAVQDSILVPDFGTAQEAKLFELQAPYSRPHSRPASCCVVTTGTLWEPGCWKAVVDMFMYNHNRGLTTWLQEVKDPRNGLPYDNLGAMMDHGITTARTRGFDYICLLQTDVLPEPETLARLMRFEQPVVAPMIVSPDTGKSVGAPEAEAHTGLKRMRWVPTSFILFKSTVFNCFPGTYIFTGTTGEDMMWERFAHYCHWPYLDTDHPLEMVTHATRNGSLRMDERWEWLKTVDDRRREAADRSSPDSEDPHKGGIYAPWTTTWYGTGVGQEEVLLETT